MKVQQLFVTLSILTTLSACTTLKAPTFADDMGAIRGYDPVAYHLEQMPVKGNPLYSFEYRSSTWHFSSEENLGKFRSDPGRFAPQYGGFCAYAMSKGFVVSIDPEAWVIVDGKLYLNYSLGVRERWLKDVPGYIEKADTHWQEKISQSVFE